MGQGVGQQVTRQLGRVVCRNDVGVVRVNGGC